MGTDRKVRVSQEAKEIQVLLASELKDKERPEQILAVLKLGKFDRSSVMKAFHLTVGDLNMYRGMLQGQPPLTENALKLLEAKTDDPTAAGNDGADEMTIPKVPDTVKAEDAEYAQALKDMRKDAQLPIFKRDIEAFTWTQNLFVGVGKDTTLMILRLLDLDPAQIENPNYIRAMVGREVRALVKHHEEAGQMQNLRTALAGYELGYEALQMKFEKLHALYTIAARSMDDESRNRMLTILAMRGTQAM